MSKERLEEIKEKVIIEKAHFKNIETGESGWTKIVTLSEEHFNYIIQQAKRVEELKKDRDALEIKIDKAYRSIHNYKQALEFASSELEYAHVTGDIAQKDKLIKDSINIIENALEREG